MTQLTEKKPGTDMSPMKSATDLQAPEESAEETREEFVGRSLSVEFCTQCGYAKRFSDLSTKLAKRFPGLTVLANPQPPRMKAFEVTLDDGTTLFSKIEMGRFPDEDVLLDRLLHALRTKHAWYTRAWMSWRRLPFGMKAIIISGAVSVPVIALALSRMTRRNQPPLSPTDD